MNVNIGYKYDSRIEESIKYLRKGLKNTKSFSTRNKKKSIYKKQGFKTLDLA